MKPRPFLFAASLLMIAGLLLGAARLHAKPQFRATATSHSVALTWTESSSCTSPCIITYNLFRGTTAGGEGTTPINSSPITGLTYTDTNVSLGTTYYYVLEAVETSGTLVLTSPNSNEVSATFPNAPAAPVLGSPVVN